MWGIHCDVPTLDFVGNSFISLGWDEAPDLRTIGADKEKLKARLAEWFPDARPGALRVWAGLLIRFDFEMTARRPRRLPQQAHEHGHIVEISGGYERHADEPSHRHRRPVKVAQGPASHDPRSATARSTRSAQP
jgi:predicted Mrr-cat superfamily restriction endonuclease